MTQQGRVGGCLAPRGTAPHRAARGLETPAQGERVPRRLPLSGRKRVLEGKPGTLNSHPSPLQGHEGERHRGSKVAGNPGINVSREHWRLG